MADLVLVTTTASAEEAIALIGKELQEPPDSSIVDVIETDSLVGDTQTIIAISAVVGQALLVVRSICLELIRRKHGVRLKVRDLEVEVDNATDLKEVLDHLERSVEPRSGKKRLDR